MSYSEYQAKTTITATELQALIKERNLASKLYGAGSTEAQILNKMVNESSAKVVSGPIDYKVKPTSFMVKPYQIKTDTGVYGYETKSAAEAGAKELATRYTLEYEQNGVKVLQSFPDYPAMKKFEATQPKFSVTAPDGATTYYKTETAAKRYAATLPSWYDPTLPVGERVYYQTQTGARAAGLKGRLEQLEEVAAAITTALPSRMWRVYYFDVKEGDTYKDFTSEEAAEKFLKEQEVLEAELRRKYRDYMAPKIKEYTDVKVQQQMAEAMVDKGIISVTAGGGYELDRRIGTLTPEEILVLRRIGFDIPEEIAPGWGTISEQLKDAPPLQTEQVKLSTEEMEELLEQGKLDAGQITQAFRTGDLTFTVLVEPDEPRIGNVFEKWRNAATSLNVESNSLRGETGWGKNKFERTAEEDANKLKRQQLGLQAGVYNMFGATFNPTGYIIAAAALGRGAVDLITNPVGTLTKTGPAINMVITQLENDRKRDPEGFTYNLVGNAIAFVGVNFAIGKTFTAIKPGVKFYADSVSGQLGKLGTRGKAAWKAIDWDSVIFEDDFAKELKLFKKIDFLKADDIGEFISKSGQTGFVSFDPVPGAYNNIWQEFRTYMRMKHDFKFISALPTDELITNPRILRDIKTFLKHRSEYLVSSQLDEFASFMDDAIAGIAKFAPDVDIPRTTVTKWDEMVAFWKAKGYIVNPEVSAAFRLNYVQPSTLDYIRAYWKMASPDAKGVSKFLGFTDLDDLVKKFGGAAKGKITPYYKTGMGLEDIPWPTTAEQFKNIKFFKDIFDDAEYAEAFKFFTEINKAGVATEIAAFTKVLKNSGVSETIASGMIGDYAVALTAIYMAEQTVTPEAARLILQNAVTSMMNMAERSSSGISADIMAGALLDIQIRLSHGVVSGQFTGLKDLSASLTELRNSLDSTGKLSPVEIQKLYTDLMDSFGIKEVDVVVEDVDFFPAVIKSYQPLDIEQIIEPIPDVDEEERLKQVPPEQLQAQRLRLLEEGRLEAVPARAPPLGIRPGRPEMRVRKPSMKLPRSEEPEPYRVSFQYTTGASETEKPMAHSYIEALNIAKETRTIQLEPLETVLEHLVHNPHNPGNPKKIKKLKKKPKRERRPGAEPEEEPGRPPGRRLTTKPTRVSGGKGRHEKEGEDPRRKRRSRKRTRVVR